MAKDCEWHKSIKCRDMGEMAFLKTGNGRELTSPKLFPYLQPSLDSRTKAIVLYLFSGVIER